MLDLSALEKLRPCGRLETFSTARHHLGFYKNVSCAATYINPSSTLPLETLIPRALRVVISRHPMLSAIPLNEGKSYPEVYFARLPSIDLDTCVTYVERKSSIHDGERDEELDRVLEEQHNRNFKDDVGTKPFWRLIVLHGPAKSDGFTAVWVFHHALADGTSALLFHQNLLSALQAVTSKPSENEQVKFDSPQTSLLPPIEELHPLPLSPWFVLKALLGSIWPKWFDRRPAKLWTGGAISDNAAHLHSKVRSITLSSSTTKGLLELSRKNKTTMTATLQCIIASAVLSNLDAEKYERVKVDGPISLRRFLKWEGGNIQAELLTGMTEYFYIHKRPSERSSSFFWNEARNVRAAIQTELNKKGHNSVIALLRYVSDIHKFFLQKVGQERSNTFEMSNVGVFNPQENTGEEDEWTIGRCTFSQSPNVSGAAFASSVVTGGDGCAVIVFTWYDGIMEAGMMEKVTECVNKEVEQLFDG